MRMVSDCVRSHAQQLTKIHIASCIQDVEAHHITRSDAYAFILFCVLLCMCTPFLFHKIYLLKYTKRMRLWRAARKTRENFIYTHINYNRYGIFLAIVQHTQTHTHTSRLKHYSPYRRFTISLPPSHLYSFGRSTKESESENLRAIGSHRSFYFHFHS